MSFGLRNAAQTFQWFMDEVLRGLRFYFVYLDDILVYSHSHGEHERHLWVLFSRLQKYGIIINPTKCNFHATEVTFLVYKVTAEGSIHIYIIRLVCVWTMCGSLVIYGNESIPSVQGEWLLYTRA
jgi:hypothetical protein